MAVIAVISGCAKAHLVVPYKDASHHEYVYYALPLTVITATATVSVSEVDADPPCADMREEMGLKPPKITAGKYFSLHKVALAKRAEADPDERYAVQLDSAGSDTLGLTLNNQGALTKGSSESTDVVLPAVTGALSFATTIASKALPFKALLFKPKHHSLACEDAKKQLVAARKAMTELYTSGTAGDTKEVVEYKAAKLIMMASALEAPFTGIKPGAPKDIVCELSPSSQTGGSADFALFSWRKDQGVDALTPSAGCTIPEGLSISDKPATSADPNEQAALQRRHDLNTRVRARDTALATISPTKVDTERSFFYRIPAMATVDVVDVVDAVPTLKSDRVEWAIPQLGITHSLPRLRSTGSASVTVALDAETGALLELAATSKEADFGTALTTAGTAIGGLLQAQQDADKDTTLEKLQREQAILEAQVAIKAAKDALGEN